MKVLLENWKKYIHEAFETKNKSLKQIISELDQLSNSPFIYFDTETLGLNAKEDQITQLAYSIIQGGQKESTKEDNIIAYLTDETRRRFKEGTEENLKWKEKGSKYAQKLQSILSDKEQQLIDPNTKEEDKEGIKTKIKNISKDLKMVTDPKYILQYTGYDESTATMTEKEMLATFLSTIDENPNSTLVAHNIGFDLRFVNARNALYGFPGLEEGKNIHTLLDTLKVCKSVYVPALENLRNNLEKQLNSISGEKIQQEAEQDIKNLSLQVQKVSSDMKDEEKRKVLLNILLDAVDRTLQRSSNVIDQKLEEEEKYSAKLGDIAKTFNIDPAGAHIAIEDVRMLVQIFKEMKRIMVLVDNFIGHGDIVITEFINEVEEFQKQVKARHPKQINRLLSHGGNKDKLFKKPSLKRSKSAPPSAVGGY